MSAFLQSVSSKASASSGMRSNACSSFEMTPEQMVDYVMAWQPLTVAMRVGQRSGGESVGYYLYRLTAPDTPATQVVTPLDEKYERGDTVAVALKGVRLPDGSVVGTEFTHGPMSCGRIVGVTDKPIGTRLTDFGDEGQGSR